MVGTSVATAKVKPKKKPVAAKTAKCQLGQNTAQTKCTANPLFSKDVCNDYLSQVQALASPGATVTTAGNRYGPVANIVGCAYTVNGNRGTQAFNFTVEGGAGFHTNSLSNAKKQIDLQQAFEEEYQQWVMMVTASQCAPGSPEPASTGTVKTTIDGYEAFTVDPCPSTINGVVTSYGQVEVLAGNRWVIVATKPRPGFSTTTSQLIPFAEQLIAKYK